jgi:hypothetical protein
MPTALSAKLKQAKNDGQSRTARRRYTKSVRYGSGKINAGKTKRR